MEEWQQAQQHQVFTQFARASNFVKHYALEVSIETTPVDFRIYAINEAQQQQHPINRSIIVENRIQESAFILPPFTAKTLHENLGKAIKDFESQYGDINLPN